MSFTSHALPDDPIALRNFAAAMQAAHAALERDHAELRYQNHALRQEAAANKTEIHNKTILIEKLRAELDVLKRDRFGRSSEKLERRIDQLELCIEDLEIDVAGEKWRKSTPAGGASPEKLPTPDEGATAPRRSYPAHLPREIVVHQPACICPACGGARLKRMGADEREVLEYVPAHFKVIVHVRPKMSCRDCETIIQPPMPSLPIERGMPGPALLSHVLVSKYCDHLPLHRQAGIYARGDVPVERSTMVDWVAKMAELMEPLGEAIVRHVRRGETLHADDTPVPVLAPGNGKTKTGRVWVAVRDERPWASGVPPAALYRYAPDRKATRAEALLKDCRGYLHADGYAGFNNLYAVNPVTGRARLTEVACWAHARRKIYEVHAATASPAALDLLRRIGELFAIETEIKGHTPEERRAVRQERALPLLADLKAQMERALRAVSPKGSLAQAIRYALSRWPALIRYTEDGRLDISNNAAERAIRPLAIGRKNWTFAGSDAGGERAAIFYTLIETAKLNGLDPERYLRDIIGRIADHPINRIDELLPWNVRP
jgi:transposase